jgi:predicted MFS family arabinose efflux permease
VLGRVLDDTYPLAVRRNVTTVTVARLVSNALYRFAAPFLAVIARGFDVSISEIAIALTIAELCAVASPLIGHVVVDRVSRRTAMTVGLTGVASGAFVTALAPNVPAFTVGLVVISAFKIMFDLSMGAWIIDHVEFARRSRVVGLTETAWALGLLVGVSTMGLITAATSWPWGYAAGGLAAAVMAVVIRARIAPDAAGGHASRSEIAARHDGLALPATGWLAVGAMLALSAASQSVFVTFGSWLEDDFDVSTATLAGITFGLGAVELGASSLSSLRTDRWGKERSVVGGAVLMAIGGTGFAAVDANAVAGMAALALLIGAFEFGIVSAVPIGGDLMPGRPGRGLGVFLGATAVGRGATTIPTTRLYDAHGMAACALLASVLALVAAVAMGARWRLVARPRLRPAPAQPR